MQQLINDLRLSRKFLLGGRLILAMLAVPLELVLSTGLASLARSATALSCVAPAIAAAQEIQLMQLQRAQSANLLSGNEDARAPREALQARSTEAMQAQFSATQTFGNAPTEQRVRKSSNSIATGASEVATGSLDLSQRTEEQASNLEQLDQVTQQNAALVEESSATADSLDQHARQLVAAVGVFQLGADAAPLALR